MFEFNQNYERAKRLPLQTLQKAIYDVSLRVDNSVHVQKNYAVHILNSQSARLCFSRIYEREYHHMPDTQKDASGLTYKQALARLYFECEEQDRRHR